MNEFFKRTLTGAGFIVVMLGSIIWSPITLAILLLIVSSLSLYEYYSIFKLRGFDPLTKTGIIAAGVILGIIFLTTQEFIPHKYLYLLIIPVFGIWFSFFMQKENIISSIIVTISGLVYIVLPLALIPFITKNELFIGYNPEILLGTLFIIWIYDSCAYISGVLFGKHKMAPGLSPKKSWEGFIGGLLFAFLFSFLLSEYFTILDRTDWMILSIIIVLFSTAGDLFESLIKREAGIKDSGKLLPGHGGILDRFDSVFFAIPGVFLYIQIFKI